MMESNSKNNERFDYYLIANSIITVLFILFLVAITGMSYQKTRNIEIEKLAEVYNVKEYPEYLNEEYFLHTFVALHDVAFFDHQGFVLINDFRNLIGSFFGLFYPKHTITREVAGSYSVRSKLPVLYHQYLLPIRLEKHLTKHELLAIYIAQSEQKAGITFSEIVRRHQFGADNRYDWIFVNSIFLTELVDKRQPEIDKRQPEVAEQLFFRILNRMYHTGHLESGDLEVVRGVYRKNFLDDVCSFYCGNHEQTHASINSTPTNEYHSNTSTWPAYFGGAMKYVDLVAHFADKHQISFPLFLAIVQSESNGNPNAISHANAYGLAQIILPTGRRVTGNPGLTSMQLMDPNLNLDTSAKYIKSRKELVDSHFPHLTNEQRITFIAASYNAGWRRVKDAEGVPNFPETRDYVQRVHRYNDLYKKNLEYIHHKMASSKLSGHIH